MAGGGSGAVTGLIIGVRTYLPTFPFAIMEGGILGAMSGIVLALILALATVGVAAILSR